MKQFEKCVYYCSECNFIYKNCYELDNILMCSRCFSEVKKYDESDIIKFIRKKRLEKISQLKEND